MSHIIKDITHGPGSRTNHELPAGNFRGSPADQSSEGSSADSITVSPALDPVTEHSLRHTTDNTGSHIRALNTGKGRTTGAVGNATAHPTKLEVTDCARHARIRISQRSGLHACHEGFFNRRPTTVGNSPGGPSLVGT